MCQFGYCLPNYAKNVKYVVFFSWEFLKFCLSFCDHVASGCLMGLLLVLAVCDIYASCIPSYVCM